MKCRHAVVMYVFMCRNALAFLAQTDVILPRRAAPAALSILCQGIYDSWLIVPKDVEAQSLRVINYEKCEETSYFGTCTWRVLLHCRDK